MKNTEKQQPGKATGTELEGARNTLRRNMGGRIPRMGGPANLEALKSALKPLSESTHKSCSDQVLDSLRDAIVYARIPPGTALSEVAVAKVLGISRTPVREALRHLVQEDLVRVYPQAATVIAPLNVNFMEQGAFIRDALECANVRDLARRISACDMAELESIVDNQRNAISAGLVNEFFRLDELMHEFLFRIAGRSLAWTHIQQVKQHFDRVRWLLCRELGHAERAFREHQQILEALKAGDGEAASRTMHDHISAVSSDLLQLRDHAPEHFFED